MHNVIAARLVSGIPIPHATNGSTAFGATATPFSATSAAGATISTSGACVKFARVNNLHASQVLYVNVGTTLSTVADATAGSVPVMPGSSEVFDFGVRPPQGVQGVLNILASGAGTTGSIQWYR